MNFLEIISFFLPFQLNPFKVEILPIVFFCIIWALFFYTYIRVVKYANKDNWEENWYGGQRDNKDNDLDIDHGSVLEISEAVATPAEKMADIMPGTILIVGLLGTFIGLGLALNHASTILSSADMNDMSNSMGQLMAMLEGLGAKFKTSTWGLLAFLLLKTLLGRNDYEHRRLRWTIEKVKKEIDTRNKQQQDYQIKQQELLLENNSVIRQSNQALMDFINKNQEAMVSLSQASASMSAAAVQMSESAQTLEDVIDSFRKNMEAVTLQLKNDLGNSIENMNFSVRQNMEYITQNLSVTIKGMSDDFRTNMTEMSNGLNQATDGISHAVDNLSQSVNSTMNQVKNVIDEAEERQKNAMLLFVETSDTLNTQVTATTGLVEKLGNDIQDGLQSVSESNRAMAAIGKKHGEISEVLTELKNVLITISQQGNTSASSRSRVGTASSSKPRSKVFSSLLHNTDE